MANTQYLEKYTDDFEKVFDRYLYGNLISIGNTVECVTNKYYNGHGDLTCTNDLEKYNNKYFTKKILPTSATLKLPPNTKRIVWAGLFWQGDLNNYSLRPKKSAYAEKFFYTDKKKYKKYCEEYDKDEGCTLPVYIYHNAKVSHDLIDNNFKKSHANKIGFTLLGKHYKLYADKVYYKSLKSVYADEDIDTDDPTEDEDHYHIAKGYKYAAFLDLTNLFKNIDPHEHPEIKFKVDELHTTAGFEGRQGNFGAWNLIVIYENTPQSNENMKKITVFYGYRNVYPGKHNRQADVSIEGLYLPKYGPVHSTVTTFVGEGEYYLQGSKKYPESIFINDSRLEKEDLKDFDPNNVFDSRLSDNIIRKPKLTNNNGIDIDIFDASDILEKIRDDEGNHVDVDVKITTNHDGYFLSVIGFATEVYTPRICYNIDTIKNAKNGKIVYEKRQFIDTVDPKNDYNVTLWISNMKKDESDGDIEEANNVKVFLNYNGFLYKMKSTFAKPLNADEYYHITDQKDSDLGYYDSTKKRSVWDIGTLQPNLDNDDHKKFHVKITGRFQDTGEKKFDLADLLHFKTTYSLDYITIDEPIDIPKCRDFNTSGAIYHTAPGVFNVVNDHFSGNHDPLDPSNPANALHTQIVNKPFNVYLLHLDKDKQTLSNDFEGKVKVDLVEASDISADPKSCENAPLVAHIMPYHCFKCSFGDDGKFLIQNIKITKAYPNVTFRIVAKDNEGKTTTSCARDNFAVRPEKFIFTTPSLIKAGQNTLISFKALDYNTHPSQNYNESEGDSFTVDINISDSSKACAKSEIHLSPSVQFTDGKDERNFKFLDVGEFNITISEIKGQEFAKIDQKDTPDQQRLIQPFKGQIKIVPDHFEVQAQAQNFHGAGFTYLSNDLAMSMLLQVQATAKGADGTTLENYSASCYAKDLNATLEHSPVPPPLTKILYMSEDNATLMQANKEDNLTLAHIDRAIFTSDHNGTGIATIHINFDRDPSKPVVPFEFNITKAYISDSDNITGSTSSINGNAAFFYARVFSPDQYINQIKGNEGNVTLYFEIYNPASFNSSAAGSGGTSGGSGGMFGGMMNDFFSMFGFTPPWGTQNSSYINSFVSSLPASPAEIEWYENKYHDNPVYGIVQSIIFKGSDILSSGKSPLAKASIGILKNGMIPLHLKYIGESYPYVAKLKILAPSWFIYNKYDPSANGNTFKVKFKNPGVWMGVGSNLKDQKENNLSTRTIHRIQW